MSLFHILCQQFPSTLSPHLFAAAFIPFTFLARVSCWWLWLSLPHLCTLSASVFLLHHLSLLWPILCFLFAFEFCQELLCLC